MVCININIFGHEFIFTHFLTKIMNLKIDTKINKILIFSIFIIYCHRRKNIFITGTFIYEAYNLY